jgi:hypothetical protein
MDLAGSGIDVDLYDRNSTCMTQASLRNEGKIHLGFVYANDPSLRSAATMVEGAATFGPLLERWLGTPITNLRRSTPFNYAVHRRSMLSADEFEAHLARTHCLVEGRIQNRDYLGLDVSVPPRRMSQHDLVADYDPDTVQAVFRTNEVSIDPLALASAVRERIAANSRISTVLNTVVHGVTAEKGWIEVDFTTGEGRTSLGYDQVVNALWDGRLAVDATFGLAPRQPWMFRVKHYLRVRSEMLYVPSTTVVLGPFGDIVDYGNGEFYLSWYPSGLQGASSEPTVPLSLRDLPEHEAEGIRSGTVEGLASVVPRVAGLPPGDLARAELGGGVVFAWGATDIDDPSSGLHERFDIGPSSMGRYHSVDTGKLTMAPLNARMVGDRVRSL